jgi:hypothetical protein
MKKFKQKESGFHFSAKEILWKWLVEQDKHDGGLCPFSWRNNYGVFMELPFYETSSPYYFECSGGLLDFDNRNEMHPLSWFDEDFDRGKHLFVPDITIFHKGTPIYLIEIVHTNPVSEQKLEKIKDFFKGYSVEVHQVLAHEILRHDISKIPDSLKTELILDL